MTTAIHSNTVLVPPRNGEYLVFLKVSYGLSSARASYRDARWYGVPDRAVVVGFAPLASPARLLDRVERGH